jgi:hypothetical protein
MEENHPAFPRGSSVETTHGSTIVVCSLPLLLTVIGAGKLEDRNENV